MIEGKPFTPQNVLVISKGTRYEYERDQMPEGSSEEDLQKVLGDRGSDYERIRARYDIHRASIGSIVTSLSNHGIKPRFSRARDYTREDLQDVDLAISLGGDGTFLDVASNITNGTMMLGVNTDPTRSEGHLLATTSDDFEKNFKRIIDGEYEVMNRSRIKATFHNGDEVVADKYALNEVFIAERSTDKSYYCSISSGDQGFEKLKSSGLLFSTGTGSTGWYYNAMRLHEDEIRDVTQLVNARYGTIMQQRVRDVFESQGITSPKLLEELLVALAKPVNDTIAEEILDAYNSSIPFDPESSQMALRVRELIENKVFKFNDPTLKSEKFTVWSRGWDSYLVLDSNTSYDFNDGKKAVLEIDPEHALKAIVF